ncbi:hypothetical protein AC579_7323 [Pseudocercospora musae]|uniref:Uncharacterized protein n=1 Tax=Pseudocercospora musae TaxID=113226 RepID=A0A139I914_9PEZI|nr:hypothetical protein AC579_7323 [Pseudocercospora musae]
MQAQDCGEDSVRGLQKRALRCAQSEDGGTSFEMHQVFWWLTRFTFVRSTGFPTAQYIVDVLRFVTCGREMRYLLRDELSGRGSGVALGKNDAVSRPF